jgi:MraZ protein
LLPPFLREFARIDSEVVIAGMYGHLEIWNSEDWQPVREASEGDAQRWETLGI